MKDKDYRPAERRPIASRDLGVMQNLSAWLTRCGLSAKNRFKIDIARLEVGGVSVGKIRGEQAGALGTQVQCLGVDSKYLVTHETGPRVARQSPRGAIDVLVDEHQAIPVP